PPGLLLRKLAGAAHKAFTALGSRGTFVPLHLELLARSAREPPRVRDDGDSTEQTGEIFAAFDDKGMAHARHCLDGVQVGADHLASEYGALLEDGIKHSGDSHVDSIQRLAGEDGGVVDTRRRLADNFE